jgi:putative thioredoxin
MQPTLSAAPVPADVVKDTSTAAFRADVVDASMQQPVIVDFWAPWCGPCKQLTPLLEKAVRAARGKVKLVKLNIDENQQLAAQMRIQSIPTVYAFYQGRPVDYFQGALPESQLKAFIDRLVQLAANGPGADADPIAEAVAEAKELETAGDHHGAGSLYQQILQHEPGLPAAVAGLARALVALGQAAEARQVLDRAPADAAKNQEVVAVRTQLELAEQSAGAARRVPELMERVAHDHNDHAARLDLAMALYGAGQPEAAIDALLESIRRDREWNEQAARKQLLKLFEALGPTNPATVAGRRRLSSILFS